jgi:hypothetical protein
MKEKTMFQQRIDAEVKTLLDMLTYKRPAYSEGEEAFLGRFVRPYATHPNVTETWTDESGNLFFEVKGGGQQLFTCHSDTVHAKSMSDTPESHKQEVIYDANMMLAYKDDGLPLGADDGAGVWLCMQIIEAGLPCTVAVFRAEERGGVGSSASAEASPDFYRQFDSAVAFDRRGASDIITNQAAGRCASDTWAMALADQLNAHGLDYEPCDGGIFTDTANLTRLVPECSNISVGYENEHSGNETLDVTHLLALRDAVLNVDWSTLPIKRDPNKADAWADLYGSSHVGFRLDFGQHYEPTTYTVEDLINMSQAELADAAALDPDEFAAAVYQLIHEEF